MIGPEFIAPYTISNIVSVVLLVSAYRWPRISRILFVLIFLIAGLFNIYTAMTEPEAYLFYGDMAVLEPYRHFIHGFFSIHTQEIVLAIALGQLCVAALLSFKGKLFKLGIVGGVIFFIAITPLGIGSAFPATLLMAIALITMHYQLVKRRDKDAYLIT